MSMMIVFEQQCGVCEAVTCVIDFHMNEASPSPYRLKFC